MLSLYVHIPFCVGKCPYCGFYSTRYSPEHADRFLAAFALDAARVRETVPDRAIGTVYIGGGTPTVLEEAQADRLLDIVRTSFRIADDAEITVEANPGSATERKLIRWRQGGANRLSLGIQSFSDAVLSSIGRPHDAAAGRAAIAAARSAGFANISLDLMYGIPGQTPGHWRESLDEAVAAGPEHVSLYALSLDESSRFSRDAQQGLFVLPDDDQVAGMYETANAVLPEAGYERYEISNFSKQDFACRHNEHYWERGEYLGLGPAAWSFIAGRRYFNVPGLDDYCARLAAGESAVGGVETPDAGEAARETLFLALRTAKGLDLERYGREYGAAVRARLERGLGKLIDAGMLRRAGALVTLTERGVLVSNEVISRLFS